DLTEQAAGLNAAELLEAQQAIRPEKERATVQKLQDTYGSRYSPAAIGEARKETSKLLGEEIDKKSIKQALEERHPQFIRQKAKEKEDAI
ncbi:MAG: hypothetical protein Q4B26_20415, partial [Eubacteriales bacterium]|nr:hypothetical protein [Eubacteriales bacterium]